MRKLLFLVVVLFVTVGWTLAQTSSPSGSSSTPSGSSAQTGQSTTGDQTGQSGQNPSSSPSTSQSPSTSPSDQSATSDQTGAASSSTGKKGKLPQTASPLPLLGILGMGSLGAGLVARKRNRR